MPPPVNRIRTSPTLLARPLLAAASVVALIATAACSENRPFERESAGAQTKLAVPTSMTPPISVRGIDGAPDEWKLAERVAEALRSRDIPASAAMRSRSSYVLKGEMRQGVEKNGRSRVEVVWSLYDGLGKKVGEVTQMAAVPGAAFKATNEGVVEAMADAAAESIAPLVPSSSVQLADGTETGERRGNDRAKIEERDRVTAVGKMKTDTGVSKNLLEPTKRETKVEARTEPPKTAPRAAAPPPRTASAEPAPPKRPATRYSAEPPPPTGDKKAITAVGRYEGTSTLSRNLLQPDADPSKPLPPPQRAKPEPRIAADTEESLGAEPASDSDQRPGAPTRITPPQRSEGDTRRRDSAVRPPQLAESPASPREARPEPPRPEPPRPEAARSEPAPEQYAERIAPRPGYQYWIQIGSHKDDATARAEWQKLQSAVSAVSANVGNRIQRADLGARGVYYRVQLGPFASPGEAGQFCAQLKSRSVDCFLAQPEPATASTPAEEAPRKAAPPAPKPVAKPAEPKPAAKPPEAKPVAKPEPKMAPPAEKDTATAPKTPEVPPPLPEAKPPRSTAEKPDAPISTAPGLPGVLD